MTSPQAARLANDLAALRRAGLSAADAGAAVARVLRLDGPTLLAGHHRMPLVASSRIFLVAGGKAAPAMSKTAASILGERLSAGIVTVLRQQTSADVPARHGTTQSNDLLLSRLALHRTGHPLPDAGSLAFGHAVRELLADDRPEDVLLALVSGGGSAMIELPAPGIELEDLQTTNDLLLRSGAPIEAVNTVRRSLSQIKGGGLARLAAPAPTVGLILSDVVGDRLSDIASGPTVLRRQDPSAARSVLEAYGLWRRVPARVRAALAGTRGGAPAAAGAQPRTPRPRNVLIGNNRHVAEAVARQAEALGFPVRVLTRQMRGEARQVGARLARTLLGVRRPVCLVMSGETTVTVTGEGRGGRNQEVALAAALALEGTTGVAVMALATDGIDGPTDAAGASVTGDTAGRARSLGLDPDDALARNDAYPLLDAVGVLLRTGPTGTNVGDLVVGLAYP